MKSRFQSLTVLLTATTLALAACGESASTPDEADAAVEPDTGTDTTVDASSPDVSSPDATAATTDADLGPDASPDAAPLGPEDCTNGSDDNGDALVDCADPRCTTEFVCEAPACAAGHARVFYRATDLPKLFAGNSTTTSTINVPTAGQVTDAAIKVTIGHHYVTDILVKLTSPTGSALDLSSNNGSNGHNYYHTVFSDAATTKVTSGTAPFTGSYKPEQPFTLIDGDPAAGAWKLEVVESFEDDDADLDNGGFASYDLMLCVCTDCEVGAVCNDDLDNDGDGAKDCADADCAGNLRCIPETRCTDGLDNDLDGKIDCKDEQCNGLSSCELGTEVSCTDSFDNDADGRTDCFDSNCTGGSICGTAETSCTNNTDDDGDGKTDCADLGCRSNAACEAVESSCRDGFDSDGDGQVDCADSDCASTLACLIAACPAGQSELILSASGLPVDIPDNLPLGGTATIQVNQTGTVQRVAVIMSIAHTYDGDIGVSLIAPGVAAPGLSLANHHFGTNYIDTILVDSATATLDSGNAPYTGAFKPDATLATLIGRPLAGAWNLLAIDDLVVAGGKINRFDLSICYSTP